MEVMLNNGLPKDVHALIPRTCAFESYMAKGFFRCD